MVQNIIFSTARICASHFESELFMEPTAMTRFDQSFGLKTRKRLKYGALPTLSRALPTPTKKNPVPAIKNGN